MNEDGKADGRINHVYAFFLLLTLALAMFGGILFSSGDRIFSRSGTDVWSLFVHLRTFGFGQMKQGHLPLWNPHLFSGIPCLGGMQAALLYPLNWLYLFLPLPTAINAGIILHVFMIGYFMYLWTSSRGLHPWACLLSACLVMFSGPSMMNVYAGQLTDICTMAWAPLLFLAVDKLLSRPSLGPALLAIFTVTMQILAGHPQYLYYTALTVMIYAGLHLIPRERRWSSLFVLAAVYAGGAAVSAVQLLPGLEAAREGVRSAGVSYSFASQFSFPPENIVTVIAPFFFGDLASLPYWGKAYPWAMTFYIGIAGLALALYGAACGEKRVRRFPVTMAVILLVLALGANTPLFHVLYTYFPGFDKFRGSSKFIFPATIFFAMLAGIGMNELLKRSRSFGKGALIAGGAGLLLGGLAFWIYSAGHTPAAPWWHHFMRFVGSSGSYLGAELYDDPVFIGKAATVSALSLAISASLCWLVALCFFIMQSSRKAVHIFLLLALLEIVAFAGFLRIDFDMKEVALPEVAAFLRSHPGDYRILNLVQPNSALSLGARDIWGYDPGVTLRYATFVAFTQGVTGKAVSNYLDFKGYHKFFSMLRLRYIISRQGQNIMIHEYKDVMPRLQLIHNVKVISKTGDILNEMAKESFNPREDVVLEKPPAVQPAPAGAKGVCRITASTTDSLTISATTSADSLLLITDSYSTGWRAHALSGSDQTQYEIMPADYTLMAIPLAAGNHRFVIAYEPPGFRVGKWISLISLALFLAFSVFAWRRSRLGRPGVRR